MATVSDIQHAVERLWPAASAESWDAVGLIAGDPADEVSSILLAVDAVLDTASEGIASGAGMLLVHHPLLLRGATSVAATDAKGRIVTDLVRARCALLAAHTNADIVARGTSGELARAIGLTASTPIVTSGGSAGDAELEGLGRVGDLAAPISLGDLARTVAAAIPSTASGVRVAGDWGTTVQRIAVCGGAGDSLLGHEAVLGADVYVTSDLRHHPASAARDDQRMGRGPALIDISHWASEWLWLDAAAEQLREALPGVTVTVSETRTDPWDFAVQQSAARD